MRAFHIEFVDEAVETDLVLQHVHLGRARGLLLECEVHALVLAVLLRVARPDAFDGNTEPQPPDGEFRQIIEAVGTGEGDAVIASDRLWQATFGKQPAKGLEDRGLLRRFEGLASKQIARGPVGDRQRVTVATVAELELALEVDTLGVARRKRI